MIKEDSEIQSIKDTLEDKNYKLIAFIAISDEGCKQVCAGAKNRGDLVKIVGELQLFICDIYDNLNNGEKMERLEQILAEARESMDEGDEDVRVLN